eukprot:2635875-Pleurochrysis_carterae.AAC.1
MVECAGLWVRLNYVSKTKYTVLNLRRVELWSLQQLSTALYTYADAKAKITSKHRRAPGST